MKSFFRSHLKRRGKKHPHSVPSSLASPNIQQSDNSIKAREETPIVRSAVKASIGLVGSSSEAFPPLKSVSGGLVYILDHHEKWLANKEDVKRFVSRLKVLQSELLDNQGRQNDKANEWCGVLMKKLQVVSDALDAMKAKNGFTRYIAAADDANILSGLLEDVRDAIIDYQTVVQKDIHLRTAELMASDDSRILQTLPRTPDASHLSEKHRLCLRGTRTDLLYQIEVWAEDPSSQSVYWLNGHAGSGKSTIAQSFCRRVFADGRLGASFFCSRDYTDRSDLHRIFPTLSFQLACRFPEFRTCVVNTLKVRPDVGRESLHNQLTELLVEPLKATGLSTIIAIDALDECKDNEPASAILSLLARHIDAIPHVKFFVTGRPEPPIRNGFRLPSLHPVTTIFVLHDVQASSVDHDIELYFTVRLPEEIQGRSDVDLPSPWPSPEDIRILTTKAGRLFIFAATAVAFIASSIHQPDERLALLNNFPDKNVHEGRQGIDRLYTTVLENGYNMSPDDGSYVTLRSVMGSIVLALNPLSRVELATLLGLRPGVIASLLRQLHAVLHVPEDTARPITIYHKSFPDYVTDASRCLDLRFFVNPALHHAELTVRCLELMNTQLRKNICSLPRYAMNDDMDLGERRKRIGGALEYACRFFVEHLLNVVAPFVPENLWTLLDVFLKHKQVFWFEVLSLVDDLRSAIHSLNHLRTWIEPLLKQAEIPGFASDFIDWITEGQRFILEFRNCAQASALHLYHSALPLAPTGSLLRKLHEDDLRTEVNVLYGNDADWSTTPLTIGTKEAKYAYRIMFSHDGKLLAIITLRDVEIFSAITGESLQTFVPDGFTRSGAFSPDDTIFASGGDNGIVSVWDMQTGGFIRSLQCATLHSIIDVEFSPSGNSLAAGGRDDVCIWDPSSGTLKNHLNPSSSTSIFKMVWMEENPPRFIVQVARDIPSEELHADDKGAAEVWDVFEGTRVEICTKPVMSMAVSPVRPIIACTRENTLDLIDATSFALLQRVPIPTVSGWDLPPSFSSVDCLVSCAGQLFDISSMDDVKSISSSFPQYARIAFSSRQSVIAVSMDSITRLWSFKAGHLDRIARHSSGVNGSGLHVSPDGTIVLSFTPAGILKFSIVGDAVVLDPIPRQMRHNEEIVSNIAISPNNLSCLCASRPPSKIKLEELSRDAYHLVQLDFPAIGQLTQLYFSLPRPQIRLVHYLDEATVVFLFTDRGPDNTGIKLNAELVDTTTGEGLPILSSDRWRTQLEPWLRSGDWWIDSDGGTILRIHSRLGPASYWSVCSSSSTFMASEAKDVKVAAFSKLLEFVPEDGQVDEDLAAHLQKHIPHPVISSGEDWVYNHLDQRIVWVHHKAAASPVFKGSWRWYRSKLIIAGNTLIGSPFILDFSGVDAQIPSASDTYRKEGYKTITISGFGQYLYG